MSPQRRKLVTFLTVAGFLLCIGAAIVNVGQLIQDSNPAITRPALSPIPIILLIMGGICFVAGVCLGWSNHGSRDTEIPPSEEPKSLILRMPKNQDEEGTVTIKVRNGDNHQFTALPEVLKTLRPGMVGTATIHARKLLNFKPDRNQPNLKSRSTQTSVEADAPNQP